jgi:hypothetical protein
MRARRLTLAGLLVLVVGGGSVFVTDASAAGSLAYPAGPSGQFGEPGSGEGQLQAPAGLAVNEQAGDVYVADSANNRVEVFDAQGKYVSQFDGSEAPTGQLSAPTSVAVDNSSGSLKGAVYVADPAHKVIDRFAPEGKYAAQLAAACEKLGEPAPCAGSALIPFGELVGVAVDAAGNLWVYESDEEGKGIICEFDAAGTVIARFRTSRETSAGFAVDSSENVYAPRANRDVMKFNAAQVKVGEVDITETETAVAVDRARNNVFVDRGGDIAKYGPFGEPFATPLETFGTEGLAESDGIAVDAATGTVYASERQADVVEVFNGRPIALASVDDQPPSVSTVTRTSALMSGTVNPGATSTTYAVEVVDGADYQPAAANPYMNGFRLAGSVGEGSVDVPVGPLAFTGLLAGTTYHYRLTASNQVGTTYGSDNTFTTAAATPPLVTTGAASEVTQTGVQLTGTVDTRELRSSYEFEVGTDTGYTGAKLFGNAGSGGIETVSANLQFLIPGTIYHYRLAASNADGTTYGQDMTFTTPGVPTPISQPPAETLIPSPTVQFPSVAGAITKPARSVKAHKRSKQKHKRHARKKRTARSKRKKGGGRK